MNAPEAKRDPVEELAEEFAGRLRRGERPSLSEYASRHPELASEIHELFPALVVMEQFGSVADPTGARPPHAAAPSRLGDFRILREVGRGGMGVVYEAIQESLGRHVALKVLPNGIRDGAARERFRREAKAAARLHHTNIVPVFAVGEDGSALYYAMQFIRGQGLDAVLSEVRRMRDAARRPPAAPLNESGIVESQIPNSADATDTPGRNETPTPPSTSGDLASKPESRYCREVARLGMQAAEALHYAHQQGVLHRDVKPSNLLLDAAGTLWVTDFGLAKAADSVDLTGTGDLIGTLRYMAPERFRGHADARSDVYSLAVTLYELLTLRPAFEEIDRLKMIDQISRSDPPRVRLAAPEIPRDLETVIHKGLARIPSDRYAAAGGLADDLRRFLDGHAVKARRHGWAEQAWRWCRRNPTISGLIGAVGLLLMVVAVVSAVAAIKLGSALSQANDNLSRALSAEVDADTNRWRSHLLDARSSRLGGAPGQRFAALTSLRQAVTIARDRGMPRERFDEMRTEAIAALVLPDLYIERWWDGYPAGTLQLEFTADLTTCARVDADGSIGVRQVGGDADRFRIPSLGESSRIRLSPDGRSVFQFQTAAPHRGRLWDLTGQSPMIRFEEAGVGGYSCFRADGRQLAIAHRNGAISVYDMLSGEREHQLAPVELVDDIWLDLNPAAPFVAVSSYAHSVVLVRDLRTGAVVDRLTPTWRGGAYANWRPDGRLLCACQGDGPEIGAYEFDPKGDPALTFRQSFQADVGGGGWMAFNPAGDRAAVTGWHGRVILLDLETGRQLMQTPPGRCAMRFDPSGVFLAAAGQPQSTKVGFWSVGAGREYRAIVNQRVPIQRPPTVSPDGRIAAANFAEGLVLFDLATGRELAVLPFRDTTLLGRVGSFQFDSTGALLTNSMDGCFRWPVRNEPGAEDRRLIGPPERTPFHPGIGSVAAGGDGQVMAQAMFNGYGMQRFAGGWILPERSGAPVRVMSGAAAYYSAASPDGRLVAFGAVGATCVRVFELATQREVWSMSGGNQCQFTPDGRWLATDADGGRLFATDTWTPGPRIGHGSICSISADSSVVALAAADGSYRLVRIESGREIARLEDPEHHSDLATLTPDGTKLVALARDGLRVWDLRSIRRELTVLGLDWEGPPFPPAPPIKPIEHITFIGAEFMGEPP